MLIRVVILFLLAMAVIAWVGRLLRPKAPRNAPPPALRPPAPVLCIQCGTPVPGNGPCPCGGKHRHG
jgi:hypothetical protein